MPNYTVKQGDCLASIAYRHGLFWEKVWNHPQNAKLKEKRKDPNILYPGDVLFVPKKEEKQESGATEKRHRFQLKGVPEKLYIQLLDGDKPKANEIYILEIDGKMMSDKTDANGRLRHSISPIAKKGRLWVGEEQDEYILNLGYLDPIDEITGIQARLNNLGFDCGRIDGLMGPKTKAALRQFQKWRSLPTSGEIDEKTRNELLNDHGC
jgi:hypothetical protein